MFNKYKQSIKKNIARKRLKDSEFTIIANDCWGAEVYHYFDRSYNTPFIGLYLMAPCYIKLLQNFESYMNSELHFIQESRYKKVNEYKQIQNKSFPTGVLRDIEIQFLHYTSEDDARQKWNRRKERMNWQKLFFKFDASKDEATLDLVQAFDRLPKKNKVCLTNQKMSQFKSLIYCPDWEKDGARMFAKSIKYFSIADWLNGKELRGPGFIF